MIFKFLGKTYNLSLWHRLLPIGIQPVVRQLAGYPGDYYEHTGGHSLEGKVALVTGGYRGIGLAIAHALHREGAKVVVTGRNEQKLAEVCRNIGSPRFTYISCDISVLSQHLDCLNKVKGIYKRDIDILVNNAGVTTDRGYRMHFEDMTDEHFRYVHNINVHGTIQMCRAFASLYQSGSILNIISNTACYPGADAYFTSKWAIYSFTQAFGHECHRQGKDIQVNGICPGPIRTDMTPGNSYIWGVSTANRRVGIPEDIGELAVILLVDSFRGCSGTIVISDGGQIL